MLLHKKTIALLTVGILLGVGIIWAASGSAAVDQKSVLSGRIAAKGLVVAGSTVREGDVLANVETITGITPAARATVDGTVSAVFVKPGDMIKSGDAVARIEPARK